MRSALSLLALGALAGLASASPTPAAAPAAPAALAKKWAHATPIAPKVMIISMFSYEDVWEDTLSLTETIQLPGMSPLYPNITCSTDYEICHFTTGESEINAACTVSAIVLSSEFDFTQTYFLIGGIAGVNPFQGTLGSVGFARYAVQVALAYEIDARQIPSNWTTGYFLFGTSEPGQAATTIYGTEVYELNTNLRDTVMAYTDGVQLNDSSDAAAYRANYDYAPANLPPAIFKGDVATSDVYFAGSLLDEAFGNITSLWTNGTGVYSLTAQEDNASFEAMVRAHTAGKVDFGRVVLMRTASDFDRAPPNQDTVYSFETDQGGFTPAIENIQIVFTPIIEGIIKDWDTVFGPGIDAQDGWAYNADILHTLSAKKRELRDFGRAVKRSQGAAAARR